MSPVASTAGKHTISFCIDVLISLPRPDEGDATCLSMGGIADTHATALVC
jgi:hypothetical protein